MNKLKEPKEKGLMSSIFGMIEGVIEKKEQHKVVMEKRAKRENIPKDEWHPELIHLYQML